MVSGSCRWSFCTCIMMMIDECAFCIARGNWEGNGMGRGRLGRLVWDDCLIIEELPVQLL